MEETTMYRPSRSVLGQSRIFRARRIAAQFEEGGYNERLHDVASNSDQLSTGGTLTLRIT